MKTTVVLHTLWLGAVAANLVALQKVDEWMEPEDGNLAVVEKLQGEAHVKPMDLTLWRRIYEDDKVFNGELLSTGEGASARVVFESGQIVEVGPNSQLLVTGQTRSVNDELTVTVLKGRIKAVAAPISVAAVNKPDAPNAQRQIRIRSGNKEIIVQKQQNIEIEKKIGAVAPRIISQSPQLRVRDVKIAPVPTPKIANEKLSKLAELAKLRAAKLKESQLEAVEFKEAEIPEAPKPKKMAFKALAPKVQKLYFKPAIVWPRPNMNIMRFDESKKNIAPILIKIPGKSVDVDLWLSYATAGSPTQTVQVRRGETKRVNLPISGTKKISFFAVVHTGKETGKPTPDKIARSSFSVSSFNSVSNGPLVVGLWTSGSSLKSGYASQSKKKVTDAPIILSFKKKSYIRPLLSLIRDGGFKIQPTPKFMSKPNGVFFVKNQKIRFHMLRGPESPALINRLYNTSGSNLVFRGNANQFLSMNNSVNYWKNLLARNRQVYIYSGGKLVPLNSSLIKRDLTTLKFVKQNAQAVFTSNVEVLRAPR